MKNFCLLSVGAAAALLSACSPSSDPSAPAPGATAPSSSSSSLATNAAVVAVKEAGQAVVSQATEAAAQIKDEAGAQAQKLIDQAKDYLAHSKLTEAGPIFDKLAAIKLTPDQQKVVDELKAQWEKATAALKKLKGDASEAVGNLLQPKK